MTEDNLRKQKIKGIIKLIRPQQMYKNAFVFVGALFGVRLFQIFDFLVIFTAFILLCCVSAGNYILNDLMDIEKDKVHEEKKNRPLPSGLVSKNLAILMCISLLSIGIAGSILFGFYMYHYLGFGMAIFFGFFSTLVFVTGFFYNIKLKGIAFADVIVLSTNFVWRALAGCMILNIGVSQWLILGVFVLALFLSLCKRKGDLDLLKEDAKLHKKSYQTYSSKLLEHLISISATFIIFVFVLYSVSPDNTFVVNRSPVSILITVPFLLFFIMRYMYLVFSEDSKSRNFDKVIFDIQILVNFVIWTAIIAVLLYWQDIIQFFFP